MQDFIIEKTNGVWLGYFPKLKELGINHAFTTKLHGESAIMQGALNMSLHVGDNADMVINNRQKVCEAMGVDFARLTTARQVHGTNCVYIDDKLAGRGKEDFDDAIADTDAIFTDKEGIPLMLLFADCTPVIFANPKRGIVGAIHAGWRGTVDNITKNVLMKMEKEYGSMPEDTIVAIGPAIGPCCYKVDKTVYQAAEKNLAGFAELFKPVSDTEWIFDLWRTNEMQILRSGVKAENVLQAKVCTMCEKELFFSHRADHGKTGRLAGIICL